MYMCSTFSARNMTRTNNHMQADTRGLGPVDSLQYLPWGFDLSARGARRKHSCEPKGSPTRYLTGGGDMCVVRLRVCECPMGYVLCEHVSLGKGSQINAGF